MTLEWRPHPDSNSLVTECGRYSVSLHNDRWSAWKLAPGGPWFAPLKQHMLSEEEARTVAEEDAAK